MRANTPLLSLKRSHIGGFLFLVAISIVLSVLQLQQLRLHAAGGNTYPASDGHIYWTGDFETGDLSQWAGVHVGQAWGSDSSINVVTSPSPVRQGHYAAQFTVNTNPYGQSYDRAELSATQASTGGFEGQEWYYSWSVYLPSNPDLTTGWPDWTNLMQWMDLYHNCSPPEALMIMPGYRNNPPSTNPFITFVHKPLDNQNGCATLAPSHQWDLGGVVYDQWMDFTLHIKWSADPTIGFLELWMNGNQVITKQFMRTLDTSGGVYQEAQLYRGNNWSGTTIVYHDCIIRHDSYTPGTSPCVASNSTSPTPTPTQIVTPTPTPTPQAVYPSSISNVFVIVMENEDWSNIKGNTTSAPYINSLLTRSDASYASNYHNVTPTETSTGYLHPSEPNYIWLEAGTNSFPDYTFTNDNDATSGNYTTSTNHLATLLQNKGLSWKAYEESMPSGCLITSSGNYAAKHDPFVYFTDVSGNPPSSTNTNCSSYVVPFTQLATDITNNTLPSYSFITPNMCDDMHDSCSPTNNQILQGDQWLQNNLPTILNSTAYKNGGAVFITWDEDSGSTSNNPIGMIVLSPLAKGNGYTNTTLYSHSSYVKTVETIFGLSPLLANAVSSTDLSDLFVTSTNINPTNTPTPTTAISTPTPTFTPTPLSTNTPTPSPTPTSSNTIPPTVTILSPLNGSTVPRHRSVTITASASDNSGVTQMSFSINGSLLCTTTASPYACSWSVPGKPNASYIITAKAYDAAGNTGTNSVTVTAK